VRLDEGRPLSDWQAFGSRPPRKRRFPDPRFQPDTAPAFTEWRGSDPDWLEDWCPLSRLGGRGTTAEARSPVASGRGLVAIVWGRMSKRIEAAVVAVGLVSAAHAAQGSGIDLERAGQYLSEAQRICEADAGRLWGKSLCGPMLFVEPANARGSRIVPTARGG
jgi:hypothetical protein